MVEQLQVRFKTLFIENLSRFQIGTETVTELILNQKYKNGTFQVGEEVSGTTIDIDGYQQGRYNRCRFKNTYKYECLYKIDDTVKVTWWNRCVISNINIGTGSVDELILDDAGSNYAIGDVINFNITGTLVQTHGLLELLMVVVT